MFAQESGLAVTEWLSSEPGGFAAMARLRRKATTRKVAKPATPSPRPQDGTPDGTVLIRSSAGRIAEIPITTRMAMEATRWTYVLRNRRGRGDTDTRSEDEANPASETLRALGVEEPALAQVAQADVVEVSLKFREEKLGWQARIMPWEHLLASATRSRRRGKTPPTVVRHMDVGRQHPGLHSRSVLYVESAPCGLREEYSFEAEDRLVSLAFTGKRGFFFPLRDPTRESLQSAVIQRRPDVVHFAGFDTHEAMRLLPDTSGWRSLEGAVPPSNNEGESPGTERSSIHDGYLLQRDDGRPDFVPAWELAGLLTSGTHKPYLVSCNFYNSAARIAALAVAQGAGAAIGFQDDFKDRLAEVFYNQLYYAICMNQEDILSSFQYALTKVREREANLGGTGIVLWGRRSWLKHAKPIGEVRKLERSEDQDRKKPIRFPREGDVQTVLTADVKPFKALNYSILHNSQEQTVFERFIVAKPRGRIHDVGIRVTLHLGAHSSTYELTNSPDDPLWSDASVDLAKVVSVPLISPLLRSLRESTKTLITVKVTWGPHTVFHRTEPITLLAIDEWRDDDANRIWLPSFVLPGDPAVRRVVDVAQRYLVAIADDPTCGFDGYQSGDPEAVDKQAQAIWTALVQECDLAYINPPPGGSTASQRIRSPSGVIQSKHGTCLDLAVLYAACLEYIDLAPMIILLKEHAFPAYWRSEAALEKFGKLQPADMSPQMRVRDGPSEEQVRKGTSGRRSREWTADAWIYPAVIQYIRDGHLVPLETVFLTQKCAFDEAIKEGAANLARRREFDSIQSIRAARANDVTPLPLHYAEDN